MKKNKKSPKKIFKKRKEIVYCNCEFPLGWETAYTLSAANW
jgi:hypothetical protein